MLKPIKELTKEAERLHSFCADFDNCDCIYAKKIQGIKQAVEAVDFEYGITEMFNLAKKSERRSFDLNTHKDWQKLKKLLEVK